MAARAHWFADSEEKGADEPEEKGADEPEQKPA
jgi:hypothetical protein